MQVCEFQALLNDSFITVLKSYVFNFTHILSPDGTDKSDSVEDITGTAQALSATREILGAGDREIVLEVQSKIFLIASTFSCNSFRCLLVFSVRIKCTA